jgi:maltooligosyltrehalose trehalohydrolase
VDLAGDFVELSHEGNGYHSGMVGRARADDRYRFRLDGDGSFPDPASRYQPDGPHGASQIVDPSRFRWTDAEWRGIGARRQIIYEIHVGTFTPEGTFAAAAEQLAELAGLGVTVLEVMPIAEFPGRFGWGYDGVDLFAPYHGYGSCDDLRAFVDRAHAECLGVILDVVYNHVGPDGNYRRQFSDAYFNPQRVTDWGDAINYDGHDSGPVRELALSNVRHWIEEYHLDGLRLDATDNIYDESEPHLIRQIGAVARKAAGTRGIIILAESEAQVARLLRDPEKGGFGVDMLWNDDFHHSALVAATGRREAYFTDYRGSAQELVSAAKHGFLYQGQHYSWQRNRRGTAALDMAPHRFVHYVENHDQVANSRDGRRLHQITSPGRYRALTALLLLGPQTPLLFQGQEFGSSAPFLYFADHNPELAKLVRSGRGEFLAQFPSLADRKTQASLDDPGDPRTFERSRLDPGERKTHREHLAMHRDLIALRQCDPVLSSGDVRVDGAVLGDHAFVIRYFADNGSDRLLVVNLGEDLSPDIVPEPLLAPPGRERGWRRLWHSEEPCYGGRGGGAGDLESENGSWRIPAESATLLAADDA